MSGVVPVSNSKKIGCWWSDKKNKKNNVNDFVRYCRKHDLEPVMINLDQPLEKQGPFVAIVHKLSEFIAKAQEGDSKSHAICQEFEEYIQNHPEVIAINPIPNPNMVLLLDRYNQYKVIENTELHKQGGLFVPAFVEFKSNNVEENIEKMKAAGVTFPCVCKPSVAHGVPSHHMSIVFNKEGLKDISVPCVAQTFINHNAILYKLFTIGNRYFLIERPSLKNFYAGDQKTIYFNSHNISKPNSSCALTELDENEPKTPSIRPDKERLDQIVSSLFKELRIELLGIDVIIDNETGNYGIVDINIFPGYEEIGNFFELLTELILERISLKGKPYVFKPILSNLPPFKFHSEKVDQESQCFCCPINGECHNISENILPSEFLSPDNTQDDSGIETSDSCDEKKKKESILRNIKRQHFKPSHLNSEEPLIKTEINLS